MNLRDLEYLVALAEHKHFGRAALACHVSQPTLSAQLKKLEHTLGVALVERDSRRVWLTPIGAELALRAARAVHEVSALKAAAKAATDPLTGALRLGAFPTLAPYYLPQVLPHLQRALPRLQFWLVEEKTAQLHSQLLRGELDAALVALPAPNEGLDAIAVLQEPFLLAVPAGHALARKKSISAETVQGMALLLLDEGHCLRAQALSFCAQQGAAELSGFRATSLGVTLMPAMAVQADPGVRYLPFSGAGPGREIGLLFRRSDSRLPLFQKLAQVLRAHGHAAPATKAATRRRPAPGVSA
jgi:LysR family hydrogen peroxide-inducible transcriptional activator